MRIQNPKPAFSPVDLVIPAVCLVVYVAWSWTLPVEMAPDEAMRLPVPFFILEHGHLPIGNEPQIVHELWGTSYAFEPYGSSLVGLLFMKVASLFTTSELWLIRAVRLASVVSACGTVLLCERIGKRLFCNPLSPYLLAICCGLLPQFAFWASYLNNDAFMVFATAATIDAWLVGIEREWDLRSKVFLGCAVGLCAISYYFAYGYILASIVVFFHTSRKLRGKDGTWLPRALRGACVVFLVAMAVGGWFFVRNVFVHDGDLFGMEASRELAEQNAVDELKPSVHQTPQTRGRPFLLMVFGNEGGSWLLDSIRSAVGVFGYLDIPLGATTLRLYYLFFAIGAIAGIPFALQERRAGSGFVYGVFVCLMLFAFWMAAFYSWAIDYQAQGRYFASGLIPFLVFVVGGFEMLSGHRTHQDQLDARARAVPLICAGTYVLLFAYSAITVIIPRCT
ncbi:MAG: hypothetical protein Q4A01_03160 [Coriobacteriales bacterium]|nr:hypothetical protein [Coriobacteriales bacterium]